MKIKVVLFVVGSGGNFLNRVLTLDPRTVPLGGYHKSTYLSSAQRFQRYHYDQVLSNIQDDFNQTLPNHLTKWVDFELNTMFFPLTLGVERLVELDQQVIEMIHPHHWLEKKKLFGPDDQFDVYYLDASACLPWVTDQCLHKVLPPGSKYSRALASVTDSIVQMQEILEMEGVVDMIFLDRILADEESFLREYQRICCMMALQPFPVYAVEIYRSWRRTWRPTA